MSKRRATRSMWTESHSSHPRNRYLDGVRARAASNARRLRSGMLAYRVASLVVVGAVAVACYPFDRPPAGSETRVADPRS